MTKPSDRSKKKKFRRSVKGKSKSFYVRGATKKHHCALCSGILHGTPHSKTEGQVRKLSKSKKRPEVIFGGVLCGKCRSTVMDEAIKVRQKVKPMETVDLKIKQFVEIAGRRIE